MNSIILASSSPYRKELLARILNNFACIAPEIDEDSFKNKIRDPLKLAQTLAKEKAQKIATDHVNSIVIGSDQLATLENSILGKAHSAENAFIQLKKLSGKTHTLITSVCIIKNKQVFEFTDITKLTMNPLTDKQIQSYIRKDNPIDCAGSYKLEKAGISLFNKIECQDFSAIQGLPLMQLIKSLQQFDVVIP